MRRLTILLATVGALLLVPAAQAAAFNLHVEINGSGSGTVEGFAESDEGEFEIVCSGPPSAGECDVPFNEGVVAELSAPTPDPGSEFLGWTAPEGGGWDDTAEEGGFTACPSPGGGCTVALLVGEPISGTVTATFCLEGQSEEECLAEEPEGPTNKRLLTLTKSPSPSAGTGQGTVKSKPKGINCASACSGAEASLYKEATVAISEVPAKGSTFVEWNGCDSETEGKCIVTMSEAKEVEAVFAGTSKAIPNPQALTVAKVDNGFSTGQGTVKSKPAGIYCEADCTTSAALFAGAITEPKPKAATKVILTQATAPGSEFNGWSGCDEVLEGTCVVTMSEAKEVTAEFTALPKNTLTLAKSPSPSAGTGVGTVTSKPKGIKCATACSEEQASLPEDATVVLKAKAATGSTLEGWEGCESTTVISATEGTCTVSMATAQEVTAEFGGTSKAIANPQALTLAKAGSGYGTVKSKPGGIACEAACTASVALYQGTLTEPKPKAAATVTLTATSAPGSKAVEWSGCDSEVEGACVVSMSEAKEVTATFDELE